MVLSFLPPYANPGPNLNFLFSFLSVPTYLLPSLSPVLPFCTVSCSPLGLDGFSGLGSSLPSFHPPSPSLFPQSPSPPLYLTSFHFLPSLPSLSTMLSLGRTLSSLSRALDPRYLFASTRDSSRLPFPVILFLRFPCFSVAFTYLPPSHLPFPFTFSFPLSIGGKIMPGSVPFVVVPLTIVPVRTAVTPSPCHISYFFVASLASPRPNQHVFQPPSHHVSLSPTPIPSTRDPDSITQRIARTTHRKVFLFRLLQLRPHSFNRSALSPFHSFPLALDFTHLYHRHHPPLAWITPTDLDCLSYPPTYYHTAYASYLSAVLNPTLTVHLPNAVPNSYCFTF
ncbi:hypothetical protein FA13DRAFT_225358 [Coprinellus micaceus]|uniref:Uncharacterized protein n=1 Tax=Coprinellus micaceus TaxID=71717 RepID=A0A4Y7TFP6_COPMI|nr:hypothetical protein FA13DRAFT_225358 [Coprinellus micaceus]